LVALTVKVTEAIGALHARLQNGQIQTYGLIVLLGLVLLLIGYTVQGGVPFGQ
jgi:NADH-quinone oxidoreductase subunit L